MHQYFSVYYFTLLLLHVSATVCHLQGALLYLLSYMPIWIFWLIKFCAVCCFVYIMWRSGACQSDKIHGKKMLRKVSTETLGNGPAEHALGTAGTMHYFCHDATRMLQAGLHTGQECNKSNESEGRNWVVSLRR
jgi:hypothetical protein